MQEKLRRQVSKLGTSTCQPARLTRWTCTEQMDIHCLGVADLEELKILSLNLDALALGELCAGDAEWVALAQPGGGRGRAVSRKRRDLA